MDGLKRRFTWSSSLYANTKIYGVFPIKIGAIETLRHIMTPSISYSWRPDFSEKLFGVNLGYFQWIDDEAYDRFAGSMAGGTPKQKQKTIKPYTTYNTIQRIILYNL